jgi:hypothetical protein
LTRQTYSTGLAALDITSEIALLATAAIDSLFGIENRSFSDSGHRQPIRHRKSLFRRQRLSTAYSASEIALSATAAIDSQFDIENRSFGVSSHRQSIRHRKSLSSTGSTGSTVSTVSTVFHLFCRDMGSDFPIRRILQALSQGTERFHS